MEMIKKQQLQVIKLKGAPNDDITYLGIAFNSLSSTIDTLLNIFRKFANKASRMVENFKGQVRVTEYKDLEEFEKRLVACEIN